MLWNRAKNILIVVLLLINVFLFGVAAAVQTRKVYLSDRYLADMVAHLEQMGIVIEQEDLPTRRIFLPQITIAPREMMAPLAIALLGEESPTPEEHPEGSFFEGSAGELTIQNDGTLLFRPTQPPESLAQLAQLLYAAGYSPDELTPDKETDRLLLMQNGVQTDGCYLELSDDGMVRGRLLRARQREMFYPELLDAPNALLRLASQADFSTPQRVVLIEIVYRPLQGSRYGTTVLSPTYRVTATRGIWLVDAVSGTASRIDEA